MNIAVIGTGYVGLVTGTCFAESGNNVVCVDIDASKVESLREGKVPIYEPQLDLLLERNVRQGRLSFTTELKEAVDQATIIFLALPTPPKEDGSADLSFILRVADDLGKLITDYKVIVDKSTVPVGTAEQVQERIALGTDAEFDVVSNPEFLKEGLAVDDFMKPERVIIGTSSEKAKRIMHDLYRPFVRQGNPILFMDERSAELTKYAANSFLATKISFMNEIANLCEKTGANVDSVRIGIGSDSRIGKSFLYPGIGYGGSCFPKDVKALWKISTEAKRNLKILDAVMEINAAQKTIITRKIKDYFKGELRGKTFGVWGLAFKPNTDDVREAPAIDVIQDLLEEGARVKAFDPAANQNAKLVLGDAIEFADNLYAAIENADALIIATEWAVFRTPDFDKMRSIMRGNAIFDGRNLYDLEQMSNKGFYYNSIGRKVISGDKV
ncbi:UDP-glucose/GDP-mannose dehydrogenase family protein [Flavobacteriales bacterium AH-315-E23]|nr:UDP-glucose/GDP-mannose dehydrogenase family protein [Flavobacteriales bacterium AH-315-E23]